MYSLINLRKKFYVTKKAELEFRLVAMGHNIRKIMRVVEAIRA